MIKYLRLAAVIDRVGLSPMTIWRHEKAGVFPRRVKLSLNTVAWVEEEIEAWCEARLRERNDRESSSEGKPAALQVESVGDQR